MTAQPPAPAGGDPDPARFRPYEVAAEQAAPADSGVVRVTGRASVTVPADQARVAFAVETRGDQAGTVARDNAARMQAVIDALRGGAIPGVDIETFGYQLQPVYGYGMEGGQRTQTIDGYLALNHVRVTTTDVDAVGSLIDLATGAGANRVASLTFYARDTSAARREALRLAVESARQEAEVMAAALGRTLGPPLEVSGGAEPRLEPTMMRAAQAAPGTPIEAADPQVSASVTVVFALGPAR